ncbi:MAG TPA: tRNA lysidine(34) synthetase TilS [Methylococcaceae bacterium]|nr:tRNA lysidine(34) synthetase TilS [Methylococcaceae bacterium]
MSNQQAFRAALLRLIPPSSRCVVAYSGGLDSHVLLHLCTRLAGITLRAIHVHHGLQARADDWATHCAAVCRDLQVSLDIVHVDARPEKGQSPEEAARTVRYRVLREHICNGEILLAAHHADDQAETLLLQLLRGAGVHGLAGMPETGEFGRGLLLRPFLGVTRVALREYATAHKLSWVEDTSNVDESFDRNFLRRQVMPLLRQRWPAAPQVLARSAAHCAEAAEILDQRARELLPSVQGATKNTLRIAPLIELPETNQRLLLRAWLRTNGFRMPPTNILERVLSEAIPARPDRTPRVEWGEGEIRRYRDHLHLLNPLPPVPPNWHTSWRGDAPLPLPDGRALHAEREKGAGIAPEFWRPEAIEVRYRQGGERCRLPGRAGTHELKKLLQEGGLPPWERERLPLVYINGELAAVGDLWVCGVFGGGMEGANVQLRVSACRPNGAQM